MKEQILKLRQEGKTYKQIMDIVGCAKSTVSYHCNPKVKADTLARTQKSRIDNNKSLQQRMKHKLRSFRINKRTDEELDGSITFEEIYDKYGEVTNCYLSGKTIDLNSDEYHLDHIIPISKGGTCNLDNLGITCPEANYAKYNMELNEFLKLCTDILEYNGYQIIKTKKS